jgi:group II intron reverse transcriptase/maturase
MSHKFLEIVHTRSLQGLHLERVYRKLKDRDLMLAAYGKLYSKQGATTPGVDPTDTVDGMSLQRIDNLIEALDNGTYQWKPVRRQEIPKKNGKTRPLGIPSWTDKLLQEGIRLILEAYYEPRFSQYSHGYRPQPGCHTALQAIQKGWRGVKWFIEIDIKGCFEHIDHDILLDLIFRDIKDVKFRKLLKEMLQAGYMQDWHYHRTFSGTPQGGLCKESDYAK